MIITPYTFSKDSATRVVGATQWVEKQPTYLMGTTQRRHEAPPSTAVSGSSISYYYKVSNLSAYDAPEEQTGWKCKLGYNLDEMIKVVDNIPLPKYTKDDDTLITLPTIGVTGDIGENTGYAYVYITYDIPTDKDNPVYNQRIEVYKEQINSDRFFLIGIVSVELADKGDVTVETIKKIKYIRLQENGIYTFPKNWDINWLPHNGDCSLYPTNCKWRVEYFHLSLNSIRKLTLPELILDVTTDLTYIWVEYTYTFSTKTFTGEMKSGTALPTGLAEGIFVHCIAEIESEEKNGFRYITKDSSASGASINNTSIIYA